MTGHALISFSAVLSALLSSHTTPSVSVAVVEHRHIVYVSAAGSARLNPQRAATPETLYHIGSITKLFTAVSIMQLIRERKLGINDSLSAFYPSIPNAKEITIRELLMHRSGIPNYLDTAIATGDVLHPTSPDAILSEVAKEKPDSLPDKQFEYSNTNYVILGQIIERVSGMPLASYYAAHIFVPAGMHMTYVGSAPKDAQSAVGYFLSNSRHVQNPGDPSWYYGCGDILSTASDLARFDIALMNGTLLDAATLREMIAA
ncbi:MAG: serine hydrolase domain-containing protein, partial [Vulcanimicrobiaceae bacterium]